MLVRLSQPPMKESLLHVHCDAVSIMATSGMTTSAAAVGQLIMTTSLPGTTSDHDRWTTPLILLLTVLWVRGAATPY